MTNSLTGFRWEYTSRSSCWLFCSSHYSERQATRKVNADRDMLRESQLTSGIAEEFWSSCLKLTTIVIFLIAAIVFVNGGASEGPYSSYVGNRIWNNPGPFANGFKGVCSVFVTAAFSFAGTELIGLAATEHPNPRKALPAAVKGTIYRISIVFVASLTMVGLLLPYNDPDLLGGTGSNASPFVLVFVRGGVCRCHLHRPIQLAHFSAGPRPCQSDERRHSNFSALHRPQLCLCRITTNAFTRRTWLCAKTLHESRQSWTANLCHSRGRHLHAFSLCSDQ